jgi:para-nitrobenzyl esterase
MSPRFTMSIENTRQSLRRSLQKPIGDFEGGRMFVHCLRKSGLIRRIALSLGCCALVAGLLLSVASHAASNKESDRPIVTVTGGQVQGRFLPAPGGAVFKGIPYAAPPIGDLRWREPQPVKPWTGVRQAGEYGADCTTGDRTAADEAVYDASRVVTNQSIGTSEDCLFLNVWTPEWPSDTKKAVMVYLVGGDLYGRSSGGGTGALSSGPAEQAESSLARHGVVLVTINYRYNLLGLMADPELTKESPHHSSGNYSILDAIAALRWVHDNIERFGGDPGNVTLFGQSGGGHITSFLLTSPLTKGLIQRAIVESSPAARYDRSPIPTLNQLEQSGGDTAKLLNAPSTDRIKYLRGIPASDIADAAMKLRGMYDDPYDEGIDGYAIPQSPAEIFGNHTEAQVPMLIGSNAQDSNGIAGVSRLGPDASPEETRAWVKNALEKFYGKYPDLLERAEKIYGLDGGPNEVSTYPPYGPIQEQVGVDLASRCAVVTTALWHSSVAPTYVYEFSRSIPGPPPVHASELRFVFGYLSVDELLDESAHNLAYDIQQYWTNFAKTGDPNGPGLPEWPKYDAATKKSIDFTNDGPIQRTANRAVACGPFIDMMARLPRPLFVKAGGPWPVPR